MISTNQLFLRAASALFALCALFMLVGAVRSTAAYVRSRRVAVIVRGSQLTIDASGSPLEPEYTLRLECVSTDGANRIIRWADAPARVTYPEEAFDVLADWSVGSRHTLYQPRGDGSAIRLTAAADGASAAGYVFGAGLLAFIAVSIFAVMTDENSRLRRSWIGRVFGIWIVFFSFGSACVFGALLFLGFHVPKVLYWVPVHASIQPAPVPYNLPEGVVVTAAGRQYLEQASHQVLSFPLNGATRHGGLGVSEGPYEELHSLCTSIESGCDFFVNPANRWEFAPRIGWNAEFFLPFGMLLLFGLVFGGVGLLIRKERG